MKLKRGKISEQFSALMNELETKSYLIKLGGEQ